MTFAWEDFLSFALDSVTRQAEPGLEEASYRSAISRAYYGVWGEAEEWRKTHQRAQANTPGPHEKTILTFNQSNDEKVFRNHLKALKGLRVKADYKSATVAFSHAESACEQAQKAQAELRAL